MKSTAVFVDAGYFWAQTRALAGAPSLTRNALRVDHAGLHKRLLQEVKDQLPGGDLLRIYWYDAQGPTGKTADHHAIDQLDDFKLRLGMGMGMGTGTGSGLRGGSGHCTGLDGLIVADLMGLAQHRAITHALLVADSAQLTPGVLAVQAMGLRVHLLSLGSPAAAPTALAAEADLKRFWSAADIQAFASLPDATFHTPGTGLWAAPQAQAATAAAPAAPGAGCEDMSLAALAQVANERLKDGPHAVVFAALKPGMRALPRDVDGALLSVGRQELGRTLTEPEKRELRREFQSLLRLEFEDRFRKDHGHHAALA